MRPPRVNIGSRVVVRLVSSSQMPAQRTTATRLFGRNHADIEARQQSCRGGIGVGCCRWLHTAVENQHLAIELPGIRPAGWLLSRDRKSTRLNSSHVSISYAVFCLKKKNTNEFEYTARGTITK